MTQAIAVGTQGSKSCLGRLVAGWVGPAGRRSLHSLPSAEIHAPSAGSLEVSDAAGLAPGAHLTGRGTCLPEGRKATWAEVADWALSGAGRGPLGCLTAGKASEAAGTTALAQAGAGRGPTGCLTAGKASEAAGKASEAAGTTALAQAGAGGGPEALPGRGTPPQASVAAALAQAVAGTAPGTASGVPNGAGRLPMRWPGPEMGPGLTLVALAGARGLVEALKCRTGGGRATAAEALRTGAATGSAPLAG